MKLSDFADRLSTISAIERPGLSPDERSLAAVFETVFEDIDRDSPAAAQLLYLCAYLAADDIPLDVIRRCRANLPAPLQTAAEDPESFNQAVTTLLRASLAKRDGESLFVHRLIQSVTRDRLGSTKRAEWAKRAVNLLDCAIPNAQSNEYHAKMPAINDRLDSHVVAAVSHAEAMDVVIEKAARLVSEVALHRSLRADFTGARAAYRQALRLNKKAFGPKHEIVARCLSNVALTYDAENLYADAEAFHKQASVIRQKATKAESSINERIYSAARGAVFGAAFGGILGAVLGVIVGGVDAVPSGAAFGCIFFAAYSAVSMFSEEVNTDLGLALILGGILGGVVWAIFAAITESLAMAIDGLFFGVLIGGAIFGVAVTINKVALSSIVGAIFGAILALAFAFLLTATEQTNRISVFEAIVGSNRLVFIENPLRDRDNLLSFLQTTFYWPLAGAIFGAIVGALGGIVKDEVNDLYRFYMDSTWERSKDPELLYHLGLALANRARYWFGDADAKNNFDQAIASFDKALQLSENHAEARCHLGWALVERAALVEPNARTAQYEKALTEYNRTIRVQPNYALAYSRRGNVLMLLGRYNEAISDLTHAIELSPNYTFFSTRALIYQEMADYESALADSDRALELMPDDTYSLSSRGSYLVRLRRYEEAVDVLTRAIKLRKDVFSDFDVRGFAYLNLGQLGPALSDLNRATDLDSDSDWFLYLRGLVHLLRNQELQARSDFSKAIDLCTRACDIEPENWRNIFNLALYHLAASEQSVAERLINGGITGGASSYRLRESAEDIKDFLELFPGHKGALILKQRIERVLGNGSKGSFVGRPL